LASGDETGEIVLWNITVPERGFKSYTLYGHKSFVFDMTLVSEKMLASAGYDQTILIWNLTTSLIEYTLKGHTDSVFKLKGIQNDCLASGSADKTIKIWNMKSGKIIRTLLGHESLITSLDLYDENVLMSVGLNEKMVRLWKISSGVLIHVIDTTINGFTIMNFN
jgi:WD40 repeat protein